MYYLNVLAGPGDERSMAFCDDPAHGWVRDTFDRDAPDPRCPVTNAYGRLDGLQLTDHGRVGGSPEGGDRPPEDRST
jgi:hypothetical protein